MTGSERGSHWILSWVSMLAGLWPHFGRLTLSPVGRENLRRVVSTCWISAGEMSQVGKCMLDDRSVRIMLHISPFYLTLTHRVIVIREVIQFMSSVRNNGFHQISKCRAIEIDSVKIVHRRGSKRPKAWSSIVEAASDQRHGHPALRSSIVEAASDQGHGHPSLRSSIVEAASDQGHGHPS